MSILWMNLAIVFVFSYLARLVPILQGNNFGHHERPNMLFTLFALFSLAIVSGLRNNIGDTYFYIHAYKVKQLTWATILEEKDIGFGVLQMLLQGITKNPQLLIIVTALITNTLIVFVFYNYSKLLDISLYVFITGGLYLVTMNGIRQSLAAAIIFVGTKYLIYGNFVKYTLLIVFASLFHQSALILIPIYFLVRFKAWSKATLILICSAVVIVIGFEQFSSILFNAIGDTQYSHYQSFQEGGANILRVVVYAAPLLIAYLGRDKLRESCNYSDVIVNMSILGLVFMIISTQNWIFARFTIYFTLYQILLISWTIKLFRNQDQKLYYFVILVLYLAYYFYECVLSLNISYGSDFLKW